MMLLSLSKFVLRKEKFIYSKEPSVPIMEKLNFREVIK